MRKKREIDTYYYPNNEIINCFPTNNTSYLPNYEQNNSTNSENRYNHNNNQNYTDSFEHIIDNIKNNLGEDNEMCIIMIKKKK